MTRPAVRVRRCLTCQEVFDLSRVGLGRVRRFFKSHASGRITLARSDPRKGIQPVKALKFNSCYTGVKCRRLFLE